MKAVALVWGTIISAVLFLILTSSGPPPSLVVPTPVPQSSPHTPEK